MFEHKDRGVGPGRIDWSDPALVGLIVLGLVLRAAALADWLVMGQ